MVLNIVMSLVIWGTAAVVLLSILVTGGLPLPASLQEKAGFLDKSNVYQENYAPARRDYLRIFLQSFGFRVFMFLFSILILAMFMIEENATLSLENVLDNLVVWDAQWYMSIARGGYDEFLQDGEPITLAFFPLYSYVVRTVSFFVLDMRVAGLLTSFLCYSVGNCFLYAYVAKNHGKEMAEKSVLYLAISPFGFFFGSLMTESMFFMFLCICLYLIHENQWGLFAIAGFFCVLTRMQGMLILIPACIHWFEEYKPIYHIRKKDWRQFWRDIYTKLIFIPIPLAGIGVYLYMNYRTAGDAFAFMRYQEENWTHSYQYIGQALGLDFANALLGEMTSMKASIWIPQLFFFLLALGLCIYGIRKMENKLLAFLLAYAVVSYSLDWLLSGSRYMLTAVPLWIILAELGKRHKGLDRAITMLSPVLMGIYFVAHLCWKQVF